jgi:hypothetical protein
VGRSIEDGCVSLDREPLDPPGMFLPSAELHIVPKQATVTVVWYTRADCETQNDCAKGVTGGVYSLSDLVSYNGMKSIKSKIKLFEN